MGDYYRGGGGGRGNYYAGGRSGGGRGRGYQNDGGGRGYNDGGGRGYNDGGGSYYNDGGGRGYNDGGGYNGGGRGYNEGGNRSRGGWSHNSGRGAGGYNNDRGGGTYRGGWGNTGGRRGGTGGRNYQIDNRSGYNRTREQMTEPDSAANVSAPAEIKAHDQKISCMLVDATNPAAPTLYTGSHDGCIKCWSMVSGQCTTTVDAGGQVECLLIVGGFLFAGVLSKAGDGIIKVWNMTTGVFHQLPGHTGQILCLHVAAEMLFSGGQDCSLRVWRFNTQAEIFMSQTIITKEEGGHDAVIHCLQSLGSFLFSGDRHGLIKVWDLTTGTLAQTVQAHAEAVTKMIIFQGCLISSSSNGMISVRQMFDKPSLNNVMVPTPVFTWDKDEKSDDSEQNPRGYKTKNERMGIFSMEGTLDSKGTPILMVSYVGEKWIRLYRLPDFDFWGVLKPAPETRSLAAGCSPDFSKGQNMMAGDGNGTIRVFTWTPDESISQM